MGLATFLTPSKTFSTSAGIQAMGLVVLAVPLYFDGSPITFAWGILGLALAVYGYITGSKTAQIWIIGLVGLDHSCAVRHV